MEIADKRADAGEVVGVEGDWAVLPLWEDEVVVLGMKREPPEFGAGGFALSFDGDGVVFEEHYDHRFLKGNATVMVTQGVDANDIVADVMHDVPDSGGELGEEDVACGGGAVGCAAGCTDNELERIWVDVGAGRLLSEIKPAGAGISDCGIRRWFGRWQGGATASSGWYYLIGW